MNTLIQDLRYGLRVLAKGPGFTAVAVITLALGIGASTAIFSLIDAVMFRSLPVRDPSRLVVLSWTAHKEPRRNETSSFGDCGRYEGGDQNPSGCSFPEPYYELVRAEKDVFSGATAIAGPAHLVLTGNGTARMARGELVSGDYFSTLGVGAVLGRALGPDDDTLSAAPAIVLSYAFWQTAFGGDRSVVGRTVSLNSVPFTIVGVADAKFTNLSPGKTQDLFLPISMVERLNIGWGTHTRSLNNWWLVILARLKPGVTLEKAQAAASLTFRDEMLHGAKPLSKPEDNPAIVLSPAQTGLNGQRRFFSKPLYVLMAAVGLLLLIACANVAGLLLARATGRQKEMAVRLAVGAGRARIVRQLLTESVVLSLSGGILGVLFAYWGVHAMTAMILADPDRPFPFIVQPDWRVLGFTISVALLTGILFGLAPAFRGTRFDLTPALKENAPAIPFGEGRVGRPFQLGKALVVLQVGLSTIALIGAGLLVRTLRNLREINPGFDARNILLFGIDPTLAKYQVSQIQSLYRTLQDQLDALPGVTSVSYSSDALLQGGLWTEDVHIEGQPAKSTVDVDMLAAGPNFFGTMRIPLIGGRTFTAADFEQAEKAAEADAAAKAKPPADSNAPKATPKPAETAPAGPPTPILVNQAFARKYFPEQNPLGKRLTEGDSSDSSGDLALDRPKTKAWEIAGVVGDTKYSTLRREVQPAAYVPAVGGGVYFELRTGPEPSSLIPAVREVVKRADSNLPLFEIRTQQESIDDLLTQERVMARLSSFFGVLALVLACVGLYGLLAYEVARRTREVGIRMALGAEWGHVARLVVVGGMKLASAGVVVGIAGGLAITRVLSSLLYGLKPTDAPTYLTVALLLAVVALLACYVPARRAAKVDPMVALRYE
ncbi:MAG TPA: ABC transporter permease [Terriglobia bacterium]|nr:ABC transporter permease [Terriglobia bacterium]